MIFQSVEEFTKFMSNYYGHRKCMVVIVDGEFDHLVDDKLSYKDTVIIDGLAKYCRLQLCPEDVICKFVVCLESDQSFVQRNWGSNPSHPAMTRARALMALSKLSHIIIANKSDMAKLLRDVKANVYITYPRKREH